MAPMMTLSLARPLPHRSPFVCFASCWSCRTARADLPEDCLAPDCEGGGGGGGLFARSCLGKIRMPLWARLSEKGDRDLAREILHAAVWGDAEGYTDPQLPVLAHRRGPFWGDFRPQLARRLLSSSWTHSRSSRSCSQVKVRRTASTSACWCSFSASVMASSLSASRPLRAGSSLCSVRP